ncbi:ammonium transporter 1 [Folsomia candida]|nr:ammonium transporter 1 [Folsomia candida]
MVLWGLLVYNPCAYWSLNPNGWSYKMGVLDFGGAAPIHVPAAAAGLTYSYFLGPRSLKERSARPHNMAYLVIGMIFMWFGTFGYNVGSAFGATIQAVLSCVITNLSGSLGAVTWSILDCCFTTRGFSAYGFCCGAVVGLTVITPASGFIHPLATIPFAVISVTLCRWGCKVKEKLKLDDTLDVFTVHGLAGMVGMLLTGIFAQKSIGGSELGAGGWLDGNYCQILYQAADTVAGFSWSVLASSIIIKLMQKIPILHPGFRQPQAKAGMDHQLGESCLQPLENLQFQIMHNTFFHLR